MKIIHLPKKNFTILNAILTLFLILFNTPKTLTYAISPTVAKPNSDRNVALSKIPRVSAYEVYLKFKAGKAIIIDAQHSTSHGRRISGAFHINGEAVRRGRIPLPKLPSRGVELYFYCY